MRKLQLKLNGNTVKGLSLGFGDRQEYKIALIMFSILL